MKGQAKFMKASMKEHVLGFRTILCRAVFKFAVLLAVISCLMGSVAQAKPVTYTGFTITDGKLGSWNFHNARVYLTFQGDTNNVQFIQPPVDANPLDGTRDVWINQTGKALVTIISGEKIISAKFADNQILVSLDLGFTGDAHFGGAGVGFSSVTAAGFDPAYPLGIDDGTVDWGDIVQQIPPGIASPEVTQLSFDLMHNTRFSGRAWPCVGFPYACTSATPLHTDKGDLYLYLPYSQVSNGAGANENFGNDSLSAGFFVADVGESNHDSQPWPPTTSSWAKSTNPITYYGYLISDVTLGRDHYSGAQVYLSFDADTSTVEPFSNVSPHGFKNLKGNAHVTIVSGPHIVSADFDPGQVYVYYDTAHSSVGFGSTAGGTGYPFSITSNTDGNSVGGPGLVENSSVSAVSDLTLNPVDVANYTPATASLATDLRNPTALSGAASSCVGFSATTSNCTSVTPIPLETNRGKFYLFEPYRQDLGTGGQYSVNWGVFWSETKPKERE